MTVKKQTFESALKRLEEIVEKLESGEISLESGMKIFEEGGELVNFCLSQLNTAEKKVKKLKKDANGNFQIELM